MARVYVASPYSSDPENNTELAIFYGDWIANLGHTVYIPVLTHYWHKLYPHDYEFWMKQDAEWLKLCDCVFRIAGESKGADAEVALAESLNIPVYYSIGDLAKP